MRSLYSIRLFLLGLTEVFAGFDESATYRLKWPGDRQKGIELLHKLHNNQLAGNDAVLMTTAMQEKYICVYPRETPNEQSKKMDYSGPTAKDLVKTLFNQRSCTYRIETYWTYELCHGHYVSQFHEESDGNGVSGSGAGLRGPRQLYYLGYYSPESDLTENDSLVFDELHPPKRKIENQLLPYYPMRYTQGTICDINRKHRTTTVLYFCFMVSKSQIYSVSEVSSCDYEVVVLSHVLCHHPAFQPAKAVEQLISCYPLDGAPRRSTLYDAFQREQLTGMPSQCVREPISTASGYVPLTKVVKDENAPASEDLGRTPWPHSSAGQKTDRSGLRSQVLDRRLVTKLLSGSECFRGGTGWWNYEYCMNKRVVQYHEENGVRTVEVLLGEWHVEAHLKWIANRPGKRPVVADGTVLQVTHFYSNGDVCDLTGRRRVVEVRLRCWDKVLRNPDAIAIFLLEPETCEYVITVESQIFCNYLLETDENGIIKSD